MKPHLTIPFEGWILMRLATDPDPTDEPRGVSGYSFAFGNEPDLDRLISFQTPSHFTPRSHTFPIGVTVHNPILRIGNTEEQVEELNGALVNLIGPARLENRNWTLTPAGFEPIIPFDLLIQGQGLTLRRSAPLDPNEPELPVWRTPERLLLEYGAVGVLYEPATIGEATGIWDSHQIVLDRISALKEDRLHTPSDTPEAVILDARLKQLAIGAADASDRRLSARYYVERFNFPMLGKVDIQGNPGSILNGWSPNSQAAWSIGFWIGAWDPDALSAYIKGALDIPLIENH